MTEETVKIQLKREAVNEDWGFDLFQGTDKNQSLVISQVKPEGIAFKGGLLVQDVVMCVNGKACEGTSCLDTVAQIRQSGDSLELTIKRGVVVEELALAEDPRYEGLDEKDKSKVGKNDVLKPTLRKDWNCPWVRRDGKGLKSVVRSGTDPVPAPVKTSHFHFYSEPHSILAPPPPPVNLEEFQRMIDAKMQGDSDQAQLQLDGLQNKADKVILDPSKIDTRNADYGIAATHKAGPNPDSQAYENLDSQALDDEEDLSCCPPALETVENSVAVDREAGGSEGPQDQYEEEDEDPGHQPSFDAAVVRELALAIRESMQSYNDLGCNYEPSADELIDVLKNLENLAAINPALYRAIVDQIKNHQPQRSDDGRGAEHSYHRNDEEEIEANGGRENYQNGVTPPDYSNGDVENHDVVDVQNGCLPHTEDDEDGNEVLLQPEPVVADEMTLRRERQQELIRLQVEKEHQDQMRMLKDGRRKDRPDAVQEPPTPPKTITVMAGSRNRPSWPIAPGVANATVPRKIELTSTSEEYMEEMIRTRLEVAQAAGLKHVEVINGDETFYPQPMQDYDYPWAGSLRPVSVNLPRRQANGRGCQDGGVPWAGSLRHVEKNKKRSKNSRQRDDEDDDDDMYGNAPWMGTLRHVTHNNKVTSNIKPTPKFKKYPDEDAPNPFQGMQGKNARPAYPLTPAAVLGGHASNREETKEVESEVDRIRCNLRETRTVSSALLKVLMPKLLMEHESKYAPLGHDESLKIMEEILAMQIGLNTDQKVEDNDEAEQIIRAITNNEIDKTVYSNMADDLENAAKLKRQETKVKKVKKVKKKGSKTTTSNDQLSG